MNGTHASAATVHDHDTDDREAMRYVPDFSRIEDPEHEPLVIHRRGEEASSSLIVLIHGLGGSRYGTWTAEKEDPTETSLPRFLYDDVAGLDIGLYRYRTLWSRLKFWKSIELDDEARVLAARLRDLAGAYPLIILAGHSLGGLLARAAICELIKRKDATTLGAISGLMLLSSPQAGSFRVPAFARAISADFRALHPRSTLLEASEEAFTNYVVGDAAHRGADKYLIPGYAVIGAEDQWVGRFSAGMAIPFERKNDVRGSHTSTVKPRSRDDDAYVWLLAQVRKIVGKALKEEDPFDVCESGGKLFIDRKVLRAAIRDLASDEGKTRVLAVKGPPQSGKSHSIYFIEHIQRVAKYEWALVQLDENKGPASFMPEDLAESVLNQIDGDSSRVPKRSVATTETRWIGHVADYVVGQIKTRQQLVVVVLDGFAHPSVPQSTRELVRELVRRADTERRLRVALLDFTDDLLSPQAAGRSATEPLNAFTEADLRSFFQAYAQKCGATLDRPALDVILKDVEDRAEARTNASVAEKVGQWTQELRPSP